MAATFGSINFSNIPVAAPSGVPIAGARQGISLNSGYVELGVTNFAVTSNDVIGQRYIILGDNGNLWIEGRTNNWGMAIGGEFWIKNPGTRIDFISLGLFAGGYWQMESGLLGPVGFRIVNGGTGIVRSFFGTESGNGTIVRGQVGGSGIDANVLIEAPTAGAVVNIKSNGNIVLETDNNFTITTGGGNKLIFSPSLGRFMVPLAVGTTPATSGRWIQVSPSTSSRSHLSLLPGANVTSSSDGDIWYDGTNLYMNVGGVVKTFTLA